MFEDMTMKYVGIFYASKYGKTDKIARYLKARLEERNFNAHLYKIDGGHYTVEIESRHHRSVCDRESLSRGENDPKALVITTDHL